MDKLAGRCGVNEWHWHGCIPLLYLMVTDLSKYELCKLCAKSIFFLCYCSLIPPCILPDGTGEPNEEGLSYYNSLIDALLDKGLVYSIVWCLHNANCFQQPLIWTFFLWCSIYLWIRHRTICNSLPLGPSPSTRRQIRRLVELRNHVWKTITSSSFSWDNQLNG